MILMLALPMALGGAIGGLVYESMKTASEKKMIAEVELNPGSPEGMVRLTLKLFKTSALA